MGILQKHRGLVGFILLALFVAAMVITSYSAKHDAKTAVRDSSIALDSLDQANARIEKLGGTPVPTPTPEGPKPSVIPGPSGPRGPSGATPSIPETALAITTVCTSNPSLCQQPVQLTSLVKAVSTCFNSKICPKPVDGKDAAPITNERIINGLALYCTSRSDRCTGSNGTNGRDGIPGQPGKDGINGTNGTNGSNGTDAPIIVGVTCSGVFIAGSTFVYTFSDGVTISATCTAPPPTPTPTPTPSATA